MKTIIIAILLWASVAVGAEDAPKIQLDPKDEVILRLRKTLLETQVENVQIRYQAAMARLRQQYREILAELGEPEPDEVKENPQ